jgi:hypothetical protein
MTVEEERTRVVFWFGVVIFARLYTVVMCDIPERLFGNDAIGHTWIRDIPTYLWVELIAYGPIVWFALHRITTDVFGSVPTDPDRLRAHRRRRLAATVAGAIFLYGVGIHTADTVEVLSREREGISDGAVYDLVYFLDEGLSHYVQFIPLFFVIGWFVVFDRPARHEFRRVALLFGAAHGVERGLGIIEGEKWFLGPIVMVWFATAVWIRRRRNGPNAFDEFFVRYAFGFLLMLPACQTAYAIWFGGFPAPSGLADGEYGQLAIGAVGLTTLGAAAILAAEHRVTRRAHRAVAGPVATADRNERVDAR